MDGDDDGRGGGELVGDVDVHLDFGGVGAKVRDLTEGGGGGTFVVEWGGGGHEVVEDGVGGGEGGQEGRGNGEELHGGGGSDGKLGRRFLGGMEVGQSSVLGGMEEDGGGIRV